MSSDAPRLTKAPPTYPPARQQVFMSGRLKGIRGLKEDLLKRDPFASVVSSQLAKKRRGDTEGVITRWRVGVTNT